METLEQQLEKGKEYEIEIYPSSRIVNAKYLGCGKLKNSPIARAIFGNEDSIILTDNHWLERRENGIISYMQISSSCINEIPKDNIIKIEGLTKLLESLGER